MAGYVLSTAAEADLEDIWEYSNERWGADKADDYLAKI